MTFDEKQENTGYETDGSPSPSAAGSSDPTTSLSVSLKRNAATLAIILACWAILGSSINPYCSYGFIWKLSFRENPCSPSIDMFLERRYFFFLLLALAFFLNRSATHFKSELVPITERTTSLIDRWWGWIISGCICAIAVTALAVYSFAHDSYDLWIASQYLRIDSTTETHATSPPMHSPIDFLFVDTKAIDALFTQIEPELIEKKRTVASSGKISAKGQIGTGAISAGVEGAQGKDSTESYERIDFSSARRCLEVMKKVAESGATPYYTIFPEWHRTYTENRLEQLSVDGKAPVTRDQLEKLRLRSLEQNAADEKNLLLKEFQELNGLIFIKGQFIQSGPTTFPVLTKEFTGSPKKINFRVVLPHVDSGLIPASANLTIFGRVIRPLGQDGIVEIRPFAIF